MVSFRRVTPGLYNGVRETQVWQVSSWDSHREGTPGNIWMFPFTTEIGTHRLSDTKRNWLFKSRLSSVGSLTIRNLACSAGESVSQSKFGVSVSGLESTFIF